MSRRTPSPRRLRNRLMLAFAGFTVVVAALFGLYAAAFAYTVEDQFFQGMLEREAVEQLRQHARTGRWKPPRESWMSVVEHPGALPDGIAAILREEPGRIEFPGAQGRHYHLRALDPGGGSPQAWLLAEVSELLIVRPQRSALLQLLAWSGATMVALALLLGGWLSHRIAAPLSRLAELVDGTAPDQLPRAFGRDFPDAEVGVLARALEALIMRIRAFVEREREFTRDASHELRTPLAVIRGATERLDAEPGLSAASRRHLAHIRQSSAQLEQTVATLLALAREEAVAAPAGPVAVLPILERVVVEQSPLLDGKEVAVSVDVPADAMAMLPAPVLHILLANLIGNAFAHTREGRIAIDLDDGRLRIANPGDGIGEADFAPFAKGAASAGFGLGLSIVRRLCERHRIGLAIDGGARHNVVSLGMSPEDGPAER